MQIGLDRIGAGLTSLEALLDFEPSFLRFCPHRIAGLQEPGSQRERFERLHARLRDIAPNMIAGPIHDESLREYLRSLGITWGQISLAPPVS